MTLIHTSKLLKSLAPAAILLGATALGFGASNPPALPSNRIPIDAQMLSSLPKRPLTKLPVLGPVAQPDGGTKSTLSEPYGVTVDKNGQVYVTNIFGGVTIYNKSMKLVNSITAGVSAPTAVSIAFGGDIYVANNGANNITIYNPSLAQIGTINDSSLVAPLGMYIDGANDIWVLDGYQVVHRYLDNGIAVGTVSIGGATAIGPWGSFWTAYAPSGGQGVAFCQNIGESWEDGLLNSGFAIGPRPLAYGVAQDSLGAQYLTDPTNKLVWWASPDGSVVGAILSTSSAGYGIAVDSVNQRIYVAEPTTNVVEVFSLKTYKLMGTIK
jgi:DNA-binding beta-propeller fold protein YncE